jgi:Flp pilus assembly protein TadD
MEPMLRPFLTMLALAAACSAPEKKAARSEEGGPAAQSLLGTPLYPPALPPERRAKLEQDLALARSSYDADPRDEERIIWYGRRLAYLSRFEEAIDVFSRGLDLHPESSKLLRHRGHRYVSTRRFAQAERDLRRASTLIAGEEDALEPDGAPNALGIPTSSHHSNVWYHLGLARYLQGDFEGAREAYAACLVASPTDDMRVATLHWLYMTLRRLGRRAEADAVLEPVRADMDVIENHAYHALVRMYAGLLAPEEVLGAEEDDIQAASSGYGLGNWYLCEGGSARAFEIFEDILAGEAWFAFGYIAAEAEVARRRRGESP